MDPALQALSDRLASVAQGLGPQALRTVLNTVGRDAIRIGAGEARRIVGPDRRYSGWINAGPLVVRYEHVAPGRIVISPPPRNRGPSVLATDGRKPGKQGRTPARRYWTSTVTEIERTAPGTAFDLIEKDFVARFDR